MECPDHGNATSSTFGIDFLLNYFWLQKVAQRYPNNMEKLTRMPLIEEGNPKKVRMAYLVTSSQIETIIFF